MSHGRNNTKDLYIESLKQKSNLLEVSTNNIVFNFKYFTYSDNDGQSFEDWEKENIIADLNNKLKLFSSKTKTELLKDRTLEIYGNYPENSKFTKPKVLETAIVKWARFRITGRRRLIGFFLDEDKSLDDPLLINVKNIFFVVFLDKYHLFAPSKER